MDLMDSNESHRRRFGALRASRSSWSPTFVASAEMGTSGRALELQMREKSLWDMTGPCLRKPVAPTRWGRTHQQQGNIEPKVTAICYPEDISANEVQTICTKMELGKLNSLTWKLSNGKVSRASSSCLGVKVSRTLVFIHSLGVSHTISTLSLHFCSLTACSVEGDFDKLQCFRDNRSVWTPV